jgi:hypothetical protein
LYRAESLVAALAAQMESAPLPKITDKAQAAEFVKAEYARGTPKLAITAELAIRTGEPQDLTEKFVALTLAGLKKKETDNAPASTGRPPIDWNAPELVNYVVDEFAKHRKRSDIVMAVCERTGAEWSEAQRFVGQVSAEQNTRINARKNRLVIPMSIGAIVVGFVFTLAAAYPMIYWITRGTDSFYAMTRSAGGMADFLQAAPYLFFSGIALVAGGAIGLVTALRSQME